MKQEPGSAVTPSLRLVRLVGRGAMGSVWVADHLALQTQVAIKFMAATVSDDPVSVKRFAREARAAAQIKSPHVVQIFDHGVTDDGVPYIVMELLSGESLEKRLRRIGTLNLVDCVQIVTQACKALAKAHEVGIVHRDLKPANLFLCENGGEIFVKVLDFGVAKFAGDMAIDMTAAGQMVGTPAYMSPEQYFEAKHVSHRSDLWSLGVVAYVALTGKRPFEGATLGELCVSIKRGTFEPPSAIRRDLPATVDDWMAGALAAEPSSRYASAKDMAQAMERAVGLASIMGSSPSLVGATASSGATFTSASLVTSASRLAAGPRRSALLIAGAAALLVLGAGVAAGALLTGRPASSAAVQDAPAPETATAAASQTAAPSAAATTAPLLDAGAVPSAEPSVTSPAAADAGPPKARPGVPPTGPQDERMQRARDQLGI